MDNNLSFPLPENKNRDNLVKELGSHFSLRVKVPVNTNIVLYDTFDWRLFNKSLVLFGDGTRLNLRKLSDYKVIESVNVSAPPMYVWNLPESRLKEQLTDIVEIRAMLALVKLYTQSTVYRVLNEDEKTVVHLDFEEIRLTPNKNAPVFYAGVILKPVKGYGKEAEQLTGVLTQLGLIPAGPEELYRSAMTAAGKTPGNYSGKMKLKLDPAMRSDEATKVILRQLLDVIKTNEEFVKRDIDTEFLHDFRVAIRRTRSALSQIRYVFPAETTNHFKQNFAAIGRISNQLRDLDVYLLDEETYRAMLPDVLQQDIDPLFNYLRQKRAVALQDVIDGLNSFDYAWALKEWEAFLDAPPEESETAINAATPIIDLARQRIYKRYRRIVKAGRRILKDTQDEQLHNLRIECKKLRYLMEFFAGLFPPKKIDVLIKQLKNLQNNLGDFNDLCVQEEYLLNIASEIPITGAQSRKTMLAIGGLVETLDKRRAVVKGEFAQTFTAFAAPKNKKLFKELFAAPKGATK